MDGVKPKDIVKKYPELAINYHSLQRSHNALMLDTNRPEDTDGIKGIWCVGPKGSGKSKWA